MRVKPAALYMREVTPHDTNTLEIEGLFPRAVYVGGTGNLEIQDQKGTAATLESIPVGTIFEISPRRIMSTGTTATKIVAFY